MAKSTKTRKPIKPAPVQTARGNGIVASIKLPFGPVKQIPGSRLKAKPATGKAMMR